MLAVSLAIFAVAFVARLLPVLLGGGLSFYGRYDDGVYYTASEGLSFGQMPYRDYVLLHPPGVAVVLLPFVWLGRLTSDPTGLAAARLAVMALGSLSAVLVYLIGRRWGMVHGVVAGLIYATSVAAIYSEQTTFLEPWGTLLTLVALLALYRSGDPPDPAADQRSASRRVLLLDLLAGVALGLTCTMKIWYVAIAVGMVVVVLLQRRFRTALRMAVSGIVAASAVLLPFFVAAPGEMWRMVVLEQLGRPTTERLSRIPDVLGTKVIFADHPKAIVVAAILLLVLVVIAVVLCAVQRPAWPVVGLFVMTGAVLMASPSFFHHYGVLVAAPIALVIPIGLGKLVQRVPQPVLRTVLVALTVAAILGLGVRASTVPTGKAFPAASFVAAAPAGCVTPDDPTALILMNRLTTDYSNGCGVEVDVTGASYSSPLARRRNVPFRRQLQAYLLSGCSFTMLRAPADALTVAEWLPVLSRPVLASADGLTLYQGDGCGS